ncbi:MAG: prepilin-type N-terminal cleavage/methylation domain-containing protein [Oribacterium sp.]|nr:prepilin-type N-terminal cleavage/methylation domain-containing protein [Oribacterium sp.]
MFKKINKKGFTLAELLIVVAIIGVLVAISIPIFTAQLRKAKLATNQANARAAYAAVTAGILQNGYAGGTGTYIVEKGILQSASNTTGGITEIKASATAIVPNSKAIGAWTISDGAGTGIKLGEDQAKKWTVSIDAKGNVLYVGSTS